MRHNNVSESCPKMCILFINIQWFNIYQVFETSILNNEEIEGIISNLYFVSYNNILFNDWIKQIF